MCVEKGQISGPPKFQSFDKPPSNFRRFWPPFPGLQQGLVKWIWHRLAACQRQPKGGCHMMKREVCKKKEQHREPSTSGRVQVWNTPAAMIRGSPRGVWTKGALNLTVFGIPTLGIPSFGIPSFGILGFGIPVSGRVDPSVGFPSGSPVSESLTSLVDASDLFYFFFLFRGGGKGGRRPRRWLAGQFNRK